MGGKQVWLRDGIFEKTIYYAHLDSIVTSEGKRVKLGDTIGFVANTGNAKTTALHLGIYKTNGAVNPLSFIKKTEVQTVENRWRTRRSPIGWFNENAKTQRRKKKGNINYHPSMAIFMTWL